MFNMDNYEALKKDMEDYAKLVKDMIPDGIEDIDEDTFRMMKLGFGTMRHCTALMDDYVSTMNSIEQKLDKVLENQAKA